MIYAAKDLEGYAIAATDGDIGHVKDLYFDDHSWVIRYLVVDTGSWLSSRRVLISPYAVGLADRANKRLPVSITQEQVKNSPDVDTQKPVSRQHEKDYLGYYGYPTYWGGASLWGDGLSPELMLPGAEGYGSPAAERNQAQMAYAQRRAVQEEQGDPHLRSCGNLKGYHIQALDGEIGHVHGLLVDDESWAIRYLIVDTSNWWLGHKVLISPSWITDIRWEDSKVAVDLTRQAIKDAPAYDADAPLEREYEVGIFQHYGRSGYWPSERDRELDVATRSGPL